VSCRCWRRTAIARPIFTASRFSFGVILPPCLMPQEWWTCLRIY
jgi:hypothetical protein